MTKPSRKRHHHPRLPGRACHRRVGRLLPLELKCARHCAFECPLTNSTHAVAALVQFQGQVFHMLLAGSVVVICSFPELSWSAFACVKACKALARVLKTYSKAVALAGGRRSVGYAAQPAAALSPRAQLQQLRLLRLMLSAALQRRWFALAFTIYSALSHCLLYYCHDFRHMKSIYFSICAAHVFWFAYAKVRALLQLHRGAVGFAGA